MRIGRPSGLSVAFCVVMATIVVIMTFTWLPDAARRKAAADWRDGDRPSAESLRPPELPTAWPWQRARPIEHDIRPPDGTPEDGRRFRREDEALHDREAVADYERTASDMDLVMNVFYGCVAVGGFLLVLLWRAMRRRRR